MTTVVLWSILAAACSLPLTEERAADDQESTSTTRPIPPSTTAPPLPTPTFPPLDPEVAEALAEVPGILAFGLGRFIGVTNPDGSGATLVGGEDAPASQPTWSNEGSLLAWSELGPDGGAIAIYDTGSGAAISSVLGDTAPFYLQWNHVDQLISYLRPSPTDVSELEAGAMRPGEGPSVYDSGSPHFFSWSPDRDLWVSHVDNERLAVVSIDQPIDLFEELRPFTTPMWLDGERILFASVEGLTVVDINGGPRQSFFLPPGRVEFIVSPTGDQVAFRLPTVDEETGGPSGGLNVLDLETGDIVAVTDRPAFVWEWSPDGQRLAWMGLDRADAANLAQWHFWSAATEAEIGRSTSYRPSQVELQNYLPFFTQYSVSHSRWAPDGSAFAFAGSIGGDMGIWIDLVDQDLDAVLVAPGDVAFWSPSELPLSGGAVSPY